MAPLKNIKVVDFTQVVAGPVAGMLLAELGADVIKVEYPGIGDITRTSGFSKGGLNSSVLNCNRGKRSIQIDLKEKEGQEIALKLIENADVVIQSMRPGKITKLGLDYETVRTLNPDLIYRWQAMVKMVRMLIELFMTQFYRLCADMSLFKLIHKFHSQTS